MIMHDAPDWILLLLFRIVKCTNVLPYVVCRTLDIEAHRLQLCLVAGLLQDKSAEVTGLAMLMVRRPSPTA